MRQILFRCPGLRCMGLGLPQRTNGGSSKSRCAEKTFLHEVWRTPPPPGSNNLLSPPTISTLELFPRGPCETSRCLAANTTPLLFPDALDSPFLATCDRIPHATCNSNARIERLALGPFCGSYHMLRVFCLVRNPVDLDRLAEFTEIEGPKRCSAWCRGLNWA